MAGHFDRQGRLRMVDVGHKATSRRSARARGRLKLTASQQEALGEATLAKGDWRATAQVAGIQAAKRCSDLIPLCHPLTIDQVSVDVTWDAGTEYIQVDCTVTTSARTGVEMEALTGTSIALLTIYDMIKGIDKGAVIEEIRLEAKEGGASGDWKRTGPESYDT